MKTKSTGVSMQKTISRLSMWALAVAAVQMIPFLTNAPWTTGDYVFASVVLFGSATAYELITRNMSNKIHRLAVGAAAAMVVILIWGWAVGGP